MLRSSSVVICVSFCTLLFPNLFVPVTNAALIPSKVIESNDIHNEVQDHNTADVFEGVLPNSFSLIEPEAMGASFDTDTFYLRGKMHQRFHRMKREACKNRPKTQETEVMEYFGLMLPNRCWEDCDCMIGRFCTQHSWCHDLPKQ